MKKLAIAAAIAALASTALASTALAQNVEVYGIVDTAVRQDSKANNAGENKTQMLSGGQSTSRLGFRGTENLGGGLSAKFVVESGFNPTTGANSQNGSTGVVLFDRLAFVGLADSKLGEVQFGRNTTATYDLAAQGITDPLKLALDGVSTPLTAGNATYATGALRINQAITAVGSTNGYKNSRADGMVKYTNSFGPVGVTLGYAPGGVTGDSNLKTSYNYAATFRQGDFAAGAGQFRSKDAANKEATTTSYGGAYTLGAATATLAYHTVKTDPGFVAAHLTTTATYVGPVLGKTDNTGPGTEAKIKVAGLKYQFTPVFATTVAYNDGDYTNTAGSKGGLKSVVVFNEYSLSKRTNLYASVDNTKADRSLTGTSNSTSNTGAMVGIRHQF